MNRAESLTAYLRAALSELEEQGSLRLCLIARDPECHSRLVVRQATQAQTAIWEKLVGQVCYTHVNPFGQKCPWCPVVRAMDTQDLASSVARSPKPLRHSDGTIGYDEDSPEMVYASLLAIPLGKDESGWDLALEVSVEKTAEVREEAARRRRRQEWAAAIGHLVGSDEDDDITCALIAFGAAASESLGWHNVSLYVFDPAHDSIPTAEVRAAFSVDHELSRSQIDDMERRLDPYVSARHQAPPPIRDGLSRCVKRTDDLPLRDIASIAAREGLDIGVLPQDPWPSPIAVPLDCRRAAVFLTGTRDRAHSMLIVRRAIDDLLSEEGLADLTMYASFVSHALTNRIHRIARDKQAERLQEYAELMGADAEALAFTAGMIVGMGHDLNKVYTDLRKWESTLRKVVPRQFAGMADEMAASVELGRKLLSRIVSTSKLGHPDPESFAVVTETKAVVHSEGALLKQAKVRCTVRNQLQCDELDVRWDRLMFRTSLVNLIANAGYWLQHHKAPPREIEVRANSEEDGWVAIEVLDNGPGIPAEIRGSVVKPFRSYRPGGMGIGLNTVKRFCESHGGRLWIGAAKDWSTCVRMTLPVSSDPSTDMQAEGEVKDELSQ